MPSSVKITRKDLLLLFSIFIAYCFIRGLGGSVWPFAIALMASYLAMPLVQKLERHGVSRFLGAGLFLVLFAALVGVTLFYLLPYLWAQLMQFLNDAPKLFWTLVKKSAPWLHRMGLNTDNLLDEFQGWIFNTSQEVQGQLVRKITWILEAGLGNFLGLVLLWLQILMAPVFFFFILGDFERLKRLWIEWIPMDIRPDALDFMNRANHIMGSFFRGQSLLALSLGCYYSLALGILGLPYGFLIGFVSGILSFIPYVGFSLGLITSVAVGAGNGSWSLAVGALAIYVGGQVLDGLFLTPRLVGRAVGLSPLGSVLAVIIGANLLGFPGILLGVPIAACTRELWLILRKTLPDLTQS